MTASLDTQPDVPEVTPRGLRRFSPPAIAARRGIHYGWVVVGMTFLVVVVTAGVRSSPGVLIRPFEREFGWSRSEISAAIALSILMYGLAAPISGRIADRFGLRIMALFFLTTAGIGVTLAA